VDSDLFKLRLEGNAAAPSRARAALTSWLGSRAERAELDRARLLVTELVTNAVIHGRGDIQILADVNGDRILVEVIDEGEGFEREMRARDFDEVGGRGLTIVETEASRWGVHEGTTHVWFELERTGPRLGADENPLS
jgi:anti-sigma regulatory factor (Ser/Thr protein kinase)